jgi:hypothetical protein
MAGIPTMAITRQGFSQVVANAYAGFGFSPSEAPTMHEFPLEMFIPNSDLTPINENIDKIVAGLTTWQPKITKTGIIQPGADIVATGATYQAAVDNLNFQFAQRLWTDGLPVTPATEERVKWILTGTDLPADQVIGKVTPRGGIATVHEVAVALAMAGGRPEYLPVIIAITQAFTSTGPTPGTNATDGDFYLQGWNATTQCTWPVMVVNGPISKQIRLSSGYGVMGPDPQHPAASVIGRTVRLILQNLGGAVPGVGSMKIYSPAMATNTVIAEDEDGLPAKGWDPYSVEQRGFKKGDNVVTCMTTNTVIMINQTDQDLSTNSLKLLVTGMLANRGNATTTPTRKDKNAPTGLLLIPRVFPKTLVSTLNMAKMDMKKYLWENTKRKGTNGADAYLMDNADQIQIVCCGGEQSGQTEWLSSAMGNDVVSKLITLPKNWDALITQAETDLGPLPTW